MALEGEYVTLSLKLLLLGGLLLLFGEVYQLFLSGLFWRCCETDRWRRISDALTRQRISTQHLILILRLAASLFLLRVVLLVDICGSPCVLDRDVLGLAGWITTHNVVMAVVSDAWLLLWMRFKSHSIFNIVCLLILLLVDMVVVLLINIARVCLLQRSYSRRRLPCLLLLLLGDHRMWIRGVLLRILLSDSVVHLL